MRRKAVWGGFALLMLLSITRPALAQITIPNSFTNNTVADADLVNANFTQIGNQALNRTGGTMTGTLTSQAITPSADATYALGDGTHRYTTGTFSGALTAGSLALSGTITGATTVTATTFSGSGASLTSIPAATALSGRIAMANAYYPAYVSKTTTYSASATTDDDIDCDASGGGWTLTLPTPVGNTGKTFNVKKTDSSTNSCTVGTAAGNIDGASTYVIGTQNMNITFRSNGTNWEIR